MLSFKPEWFYTESKADKGKAVGPISERDIDALLKTCEISEYTYFRREGEEKWDMLHKQEIYNRMKEGKLIRAVGRG